MTDVEVAQALLTLLVESLPILLPLAVLATVTVGTVCHLIADEFAYRKFEKARLQKSEAVEPTRTPAHNIEVSFA